jgi:hypothetical protein
MNEILEGLSAPSLVLQTRTVRVAKPAGWQIE